jgi:hypothetical protein
MYQVIMFVNDKPELHSREITTRRLALKLLRKARKTWPEFRYELVSLLVVPVK